MSEGSEGIARCPGCGKFYDEKISAMRFDLSMVGIEDETCREAGYVHVHYGDS